MPRAAAAKAAPADSPDIAEFRKRMREKRGGQHLYAALLGFGSLETQELLARVQAGFAFRVFERFRKNLDLPARELSALTQIPERTLARRREEGRLTAEESDRLLRASRVFGRALQLFEGDLDAARSWFLAPAPALGNRTPKDFAATELGAREVENLIGRLEHGVFS